MIGFRLFVNDNEGTPDLPHSRILISLVLVGRLVLLAPASVCAQPVKEQAAAENERAKEQYARGEFAKALELFEEAYNTDPRPRYLCNIGRSRLKLAEIESSRSVRKRLLVKARANVESCLVRTYKEEGPELALRDKRLAKTKRLRQQVLAALKKLEEEAPEPAVTTKPAAPPSPVKSGPGDEAAPNVLDMQTPPPRASAKPLYKKWWVWTIVGAIVVGGVTAAAVAATTETGQVPSGRMVEF